MPPRAKTIGTDWYLLRCPRCRDFLQVTYPRFQGDRPQAWDSQPWLKCDACGQMSATVGWGVSMALYEPFEIPVSG